MSHLKEGFTDEKLRELYYADVAKGRDASYIRARYGAPLSAATQRAYGLANVRHGDEAVPYEFLSDNLAMRSYTDLGDPHYVDSIGRQYYGMGERYSNLCYCRIPLNITRDENARGLVGVDRTEFPISGEQLVLVASKAFPREIRSSIAPLEIKVVRVIAQKTAVCQLEVSDDVPVPEGLDSAGAAADAQDGNEAYQKRLDSTKRKHEASERRAEKMEKKLRDSAYEFPDSVYTIEAKHRANQGIFQASGMRMSAMVINTARAPKVQSARPAKVARAKKSK